METIGKRKANKTSCRESPTQCYIHCKQTNISTKDHLGKQSQLTGIIVTAGENTRCITSSVWQLDELWMETVVFFGCSHSLAFKLKVKVISKEKTSLRAFISWKDQISSSISLEGSISASLASGSPVCISSWSFFTFNILCCHNYCRFCHILWVNRLTDLLLSTERKNCHIHLMSFMIYFYLAQYVSYSIIHLLKDLCKASTSASKITTQPLPAITLFYTSSEYLFALVSSLWAFVSKSRLMNILKRNVFYGTLAINFTSF